MTTQSKEARDGESRTSGNAHVAASGDQHTEYRRIAQAVWDRDNLLGHVAETASGQIEAALPSGESLGLYTNQAGAVHALVAHARKAV